MMQKRFVVIVLDGFGIGAMKDAFIQRPGDENSSTLNSILKQYPDLKLQNLERLGLMNAFGFESKNMKFNKYATFGKSELMHFGADTFMGHQEIMGTLPKKPIPVPFQKKVEEIAAYLTKHNHEVEVRGSEKLRYLLVDKYCTVADNIDADLGMAYNCTVSLNEMPFDHALTIAKLVREIASVNRVIVFGGTGNTIDDILLAEETREETYIGIHAVRSKAYEKGYECLHLGYGVDESVQTPTLLRESGIETTLIGKVADIVSNEEGTSLSCVNTSDVLDLTIKAFEEMKNGFICANVQETDLAGHSQDAKWYRDLLLIADEKIGLLMNAMKEDDLLVVMADHGNDPLIGHNKHTRENVPLLIYGKNIKITNIGLRQTLSDVGASVCDFFDVKEPQNGISFLEEILDKY